MIIRVPCRLYVRGTYVSLAIEDSEVDCRATTGIKIGIFVAA